MFFRSFLVLFFVSASLCATQNKVMLKSLWINPSPCQIDLALALLLKEERKKFPQLAKLWMQASLCVPEGTLKTPQQKWARSVKEALIAEWRRSLREAHKRSPYIKTALDNKEFQNFLLSKTELLYGAYLKGVQKSFHNTLSHVEIVSYSDKLGNFQYSPGDPRRLFEMRASRSNSNSFAGFSTVYSTLESELKVKGPFSIVSRIAWGFVGEDKYYPDPASGSGEALYQIGLATAGGDRLSAELVGMISFSNEGKPTKSLVANVGLGELFKKLQISLTAWLSDEERFLGLMGSVKF